VSRVREGSVIADRYRLERLVVRRGVHQVYEGVDLENEAPVAVKIAAPSTAYYEHHDKVQRAVRLGRELERASAGIVRPLGGGEEGDALYLVMDYIHQAEDLDNNTGPVDDRLVRLRRVALLVRELHALRVVHRDVRPGNFLVGGNGRIHVTNFGLARSLDDRLDDGDIARCVMATGTQHLYLAPGVLGRGQLDTSMDVYSLGVMLFQILTGQYPFEGSSDDVVAMHKEVLGGHSELPRPSDVRPTVPPEFDEVVQWAIHVDPLQRFATVDEFLSALDEVSPDLSGRRSAGQPTRRPAPRRKQPPPLRERPSERMRRLNAEDLAEAPVRPVASQHTSRLERDAGLEEPAEPDIDPQTRVLVDLRRVLPLVGGGVSLGVGSKEVKFVYFSAQEDISGTVALAYQVRDSEARFGRLEQRVTLDMGALEGGPAGEVNLLHAANAVNLYGGGLSCQFGDDRLRLRRSVLLGPDAPLEADDLQRHADLLLKVWPAVFAALSDVQEGVPWNEAIAFLVRAWPTDFERSGTLRSMLDREGYAIEDRGEGKLGIGVGDDMVEMTCHSDQVIGTVLVREWQAPKGEARALKKGKQAKQVEALLAQLNAKNLDPFYTLAWDPKRGIVAHAPLAEEAFVPERLDSFLRLLRSARGEVFQALGEGDAAGGKKSWLPWRR
jgi:serine/threonine protein kinase